MFGRARDQRAAGHPQFRVRAISEAWQIAGRVPAYKTAVANVAYIWRDATPCDRFGRMPGAFARRAYELHASGLILPASAPVWASKGYTIWEEADAAATATGDSDAIAAWHMILQIPSDIPRAAWCQLAQDFIERELAARGRATAWAIHALRGEDGWLVEPHLHLIVSARHWRHDRRHGRRVDTGAGYWGGQRGLELAWRRACALSPMLVFKSVHGHA